jgi:molecular chaperone HtpG
MLSDDKFYERAEKFTLLKNIDGNAFSLDEYKALIKDNQTDKDDNLIYLYSNNKSSQYSYIEAAKNKGYDVLLMDGQLDVHFVGKLEQKFEKSRFVRVDSDVIDKLIRKSDAQEVKLSQEETDALVETFKSAIPTIDKVDFIVGFEHLGEHSNPVTITQNEFMRRMKEMSEMQGGMNFYGEMPDSYNMIVNLDNPLVQKIQNDKENSKDILRQVVDLALLSNNMLKGEALNDFIKRSISLI